MRRTLRRAACALSWQYTDGNGQPADPGTVTVTITRADGTAVVTDAATGGSSTAPRTYTLSAADNLLLDLLDVSWKVSGVVYGSEQVEVVGGLLFTVDDLIGGEPSVGGSQHTNDDIFAVRWEVERFFERVVQGSFFPQYRFERRRASGGVVALPRRPIRAVRSMTRYYETDDDRLAATAAELALIPYTEGSVVSVPVSFGADPRVEIGYEFGLTDPPPEVRRAARRLARMRLDQPVTAVPDRTTSYTTPEGFTTFVAQPGIRGSITGVPEIDETLSYWRDRLAVPGIA